MKGIILSFAVLIFATNIVMADNDKPITVEQLPAAAKKFIDNHFPDMKISLAKMETEVFEKSYEVIFSNGTKVEFNSKGEWTEVDSKFSQVPAGIIPQQIKDYVSTHYDEVKIVAIERDRRDFEVKLSNGLELKFDLKFNLIDIDN